MVRYKVNTSDDGQEFLVTNAYKKLFILLEDLKIRKGRIIHVVGAPGTGKSSNIYEAINNLGLNVFEAGLILDNMDKNSLDVYHEFFKTLRKDMNVKNNEECYKKAALYDAVLLADRFHDSQFLYVNKVGFSIWMDNKGLKSFPFYLLIILHYFWNLFKFRKINLIFQTAWTIHIKGDKYDFFTDFGLFSKLLLFILKIFFEVVEISYTESEIIEIVKKHLPDADEKEIKLYFKLYGSRVRFILQSLKKGSKKI